jgi:hypothetical protein
MPSPPPDAELMRSLGRLVRGLSALFWGLPLAFLVCFYTAKADMFRSFGIVPPLASTGLLIFGLWELGDFQKQERVWQNALDRARIFALINFFLSPFLYWWNRVPTEPLFLAMVVLTALSALLFLGSLNLVVQRLGAMLPDETLRLETNQFTAINLKLLFAIFALAALFIVVERALLGRFERLPLWLLVAAGVVERGGLWLLILPVLLPLAMTMALLWKTKEVILDNVFGPKQ